MSDQFDAEFKRVAYLRSQVINLVEQTRQTLQSSEQNRPSGRLELSRHIRSLDHVQQSLQEKTLRLLVLGDLKRGKSTLINALLGEPILPSDVTPCTALLTVLRYGSDKQVTLHFNTNQPSQTVNLETFREHYTLDPAEAKQLEDRQQPAFPEISHAVLEYPCPILEQGLEIIDSPGLNDTEIRNQRVLEFMQDCHAVVFVFDATQPMTLEDRRYLNNYLKGQPFPIFYVVNQWDRLAANQLDSNPQAAGDRIRQTFIAHLEHPDFIDGDLQSRLFEVSALNVLRSRYRTPEAPIEPEFARFMDALSHFVTNDRFQAELSYTQRCLKSIAQQVTESTEKRVFLLGETVQSLEETLTDLQQDFEQLEDIRNRYQGVIHRKRDQEVEAIAQSFRDYILGLENTFKEDFVQSQPDLDFLNFLQPDRREDFYRGFRRAFERYMNDRLAAWEFTAKQQINRAFEALNHESEDYRVAYSQVVEVINEKLLGERFYALNSRYNRKSASLWVDTVKNIFDTVPQQLNYAVSGFNAFWKQVLHSTLTYLGIVLVLEIVGLVFSGLALNVFAVVLAGAGVVTLQAELVRQEFLAKTHREFAKYLPKIANEQQQEVRQAVQKCFEAYEVEVIDRINMDIAARHGELTNLLKQKKSQTVASDSEIEALQTLAKSVQANANAVNTIKA